MPRAAALTTVLSSLLLASPAALAGGDGDALGLRVEAYGQQLVGEGPALGLGAAIAPTRATFVSLEGRSAAGGHWLGRGTVGLDVLGGSETLDFTLGMFLGTTGTWEPVAVGMSHADVTAGFELGLGLNVGPVRGRYRHADGFRGPLESRLTENEWRLGAEIGRVQVFGQYVRFNPGDDTPFGGLGAGASLAF